MNGNVEAARLAAFQAAIGSGSDSTPPVADHITRIEQLMKGHGDVAALRPADAQSPAKPQAQPHAH